MGMKRQKTGRRFSPRLRKILLLSGLSLAGIFVVGNAVLWGIYRNRTYPGTRVMQTTIGSVAYSGLSAKISQMQILPEKLSLSHQQQKIEASLDDLGIRKDMGPTIRSAGQQRSWLPVVNLFKKPILQAPVSVDSDKLARKVGEISKVLRADPVNARLNLTGISVQVISARDGYEIDRAKLQKAVLPVLNKGETAIQAPVVITKAPVQADSLKAGQQDLEAQFKTVISYKYNGKTKQASTAEVAAWYVPSGDTYVADTGKIQSYIAAAGTGFGIKVKDIASAVTATQQSLAKKQNADITLTQQIALKTFTYCVAAKGVDAAYLPTLRTKLKDTYGSSRGWSVGGLVEFKEVPSACNFTVWLTAAALMPTFGAICDSMWSCRVGPNVVINFDRWQNASPAWNQIGGPLEDYRHMVINHETGHWLSFGHSHCPGAGQPAPVMQQQSIDLQGCTFNPWPTAGEIVALRRSLGI